MWEDSALFQAFSIPFESLLRRGEKNNEKTKLEHKIMGKADEIDARQLLSQRNKGLAHKAQDNVHEAEPDSLSRPEHPSQLKSLHSVKLKCE